MAWIRLSFLGLPLEEPGEGECVENPLLNRFEHSY